MQTTKTKHTQTQKPSLRKGKIIFESFAKYITQPFHPPPPPPPPPPNDDVQCSICTHLVLRVIDHRGLPLSVHLIVPVVGLLGVRVRDVFRLVPVLGFGVLRVVDLLTLIPVIRLLGLRILNIKYIDAFLLLTYIHVFYTVQFIHTTQGKERERGRK